MELKRFFGTLCDDATGYLEGEEHFHCTRVTRHKEGYLLLLVTGDGYDYLARVAKIEKDRTILDVLEKRENTAETSASIALFFSPCKEADFLVEKGVELGVNEFHPYLSARTTERPNEARWEKIVRSAAKQCGRARLPKVEKTVSFEEALKCANTKYKIFCYERAEKGEIGENFTESGSVSLLIGPEGGFTEEESVSARENGFFTAALGKRILRVETAVVAALTLVLHALGEL